MVTSLQIRPCKPAELPALVGLLDEEFIFSKGRSLSLARRLPTAVHADNCPNVLLACRGDEIAASIVVKRFTWITPERSWRGAMIGLVYTRPAERGKGFASRLLRAAAQRLRDDGVAFAVLWTAQPGFYRRLGWTTSDCGVFGTVASPGGTASVCTPTDAGAIDALRLRGATPYLRRESSCYQTLPQPVERLRLLTSPGAAAYAIYGLHAERAYVYEFGGEPSAYAALWQDLCAAGHTLYINLRRGSEAHHWFAAIGGIVWHDQELAMWLPLAEPACAHHYPGWYIPFLDRI